jgi:preprotein translocase subunit SecG
MNTLFTLIVVIQVLSAVAIIGLVLIQHGKGADMGASFGSGASGSLFGASGSSNFLSKSTAIAAAVFFITTLGLAMLGGRHVASGGDLMDNFTQVPAAPAASAPATPSPASNAAQAAPAAAGKSAGESSNQIPK